jgi:hypothetical protein
VKLANDYLARLLAQLQNGGAAFGQPQRIGQPMAPPPRMTGLLSDAPLPGQHTGQPDGGIFPGEPGGPPVVATPTTAPAQQPPTPPVTPYQGDPNRYGMGPEHQFFGGLNGQPYGLTAFTGYQPQPQYTPQTLQQMLAELMARYMPVQGGYFPSGSGDGGFGGGGFGGFGGTNGDAGIGGQSTSDGSAGDTA